MKKLYSNQKKSWAAEYCSILQVRQSSRTSLAIIVKGLSGLNLRANKLLLLIAIIGSMLLGVSTSASAQTRVRFLNPPISPNTYCASSNIEVGLTSSKGGNTDFLLYIVDGTGGSAKVLEQLKRVPAADIIAHNDANKEVFYTFKLSTSSIGSNRYLRAVPQQGTEKNMRFHSAAFNVNPLTASPTSPVNKTFTYGDENPDNLLQVQPPVNTTINWYNTEVGGTAIVTNSSSYAPQQTVVGTYNYYAEAQSLTPNICPSARIKVTLTIIPKSLSITGAIAKSRLYDGTNVAQLENLGSINSNDLEGSDEVTLGTTYTALFSDKNIGIDKAVTVTGYTLTGPRAGNYKVVEPFLLAADINAKVLTGVLIVNDKTYDGTTNATVVSQTLEGVVPGEDVSLVGGTAKFDSPEIGSDIPVALTGAVLEGTDKGNYELSAPITTTANITASTPLPVTLISWEGSRSGNVVKLAWSTASEKDNDYFEVQQSVDGKSFQVVGEKVKGAGTTAVPQAYKAAIPTNSSNTLYYRLKQVDFDGKFEYSKVIAVGADGKAAAKGSLAVYPNPTPGRVSVTPAEGNGPATITLFHSSGKAVSQQQVEVHAGQPISMDLAGQVPGVYYLQVQTSTGKSTTRLVKQ